MHPAVKIYAQEVRKYAGSDSTAEETYYPPLVTLLKSLLAERKLPSDVRANLRQQGSRPDLAFHAADGEVPLAGGEVKLPSADLDGIALGTGTNDQVGRYLALYGVVIVTNVRGFRLVVAKPNLPSGPVKPADRVLVGDPVTFWPSETAMASGEAPADRAVLLADLLEEALSHYASIATPASLASVLARMARRAKAAIPHDDADLDEFKTGFAEALGIHFTGEEGDEFFRSSIVQTAFYSLFAAWVLWVRGGGVGTFDVTEAQNVKLPFVGRLLYSLLNPSYEESHGMRPVLEEAARVLNRVDSAKFFDKFGGPKSTDLSAAITYFYEPFLEAFDPKLREDLGVWYTPPEIVRYQVAKVHGLLKTELGFAKGLAHPDVVVLDPCCGTGAYLLETVRVIAAELGDGDDVPGKVAEAVRDRLVGFEILAAPYVIAHLQLHLAIAKAPLAKGERPAVFLTNALTGWGEDQVKIHFPELRQEHEAARKAKREAKVIVVIGNPPYNRFAGAPAAEERELADPYKGIRRDAKGKQVGKGKLYEEWGIRKSLLDDLYIRFFRLAEERIGARADRGIVSFISNSSYLAGRSHPIMRESLVKKFPRIWVDNLHGNRIASERTPWGTSCETAFKMAGTSGVKVGTAIVTMIVRPNLNGLEVRTRDFFGAAAAKMKALGLPEGTEGTGEERVSEDNKIPGYRLYAPTKAKRWKLVPYDAVGGYEDWPSLDELFPYGFQGVNANRGYDDSVIDIDRARLERRMEEYFGTTMSESYFAKHPVLGSSFAGYSPVGTREMLKSAHRFEPDLIVRYAVAPLDNRYIYYLIDDGLLNRPRPEFARHLETADFLCAVPVPRRNSESRPLPASGLVDLHYIERGVVVMPTIAIPEPTKKNKPQEELDAMDVLFPKANLNPKTWEKLRVGLGLSGDLQGEDAKGLVRRLFRVALAIGHAPSFQAEHRESLAQDWMRLPIPKDPATVDTATRLGDRIAELLDPLKEPDLTAFEDRAIVRKTGSEPLDTRVTYGYFGGGRGRYDAAKGELWLNDRTYLENVPEAVWRHELGGYPVVKKWLGYREARRRNGGALTSAELDTLKGIVRRLAALLALTSELDAVASAAQASAWSAEELGL